MSAAKLAYRRASDHWSRCAACSAAGGEWAKPEALCHVGRALAAAWEEAERREARAQIADDIRTGHATYYDIMEDER